MTAQSELLRVENLQVHFERRGDHGIVRAVDGLSFSLQRREILALVGPAGCGKSTVGRTLLLLDQPTAGQILFEGQSLTSWRNRLWHKAHRQMQMIFPDPYAAFSPRLTVEDTLREALGGLDFRQNDRRDQKIRQLMALVGLNLYLAIRYPWELSGGNRQRLAVARALATDPRVLVCDQVADQLDPAVRAPIAKLFVSLRDRLDLSLLLIASRLAEVQESDRLAIMLKGRFVEMGYTADVIAHPLHPLTQALAQAVDYWSPPHPAIPDVKQGCPYAPVCPQVVDLCHQVYPPFDLLTPNHGVACHRATAVTKS